MSNLIGACGLLLLSLPSLASDFVNFGFDDPVLLNISYYVPQFPGGRLLYGPAQDLLKGWTVTDGGKSYTGLVAYGIGIDGGIPYPGVQLAISVDNITVGRYSLEFTSFVMGSPGQGSSDMVISQVGIIPQSAYYLAGTGRAIASINGNNLTETRPNHFNFPYWDVHEYAGKEVTFSFTFHSGGGGGFTALDIIGFAVPEPSTWALLAVGGLVLGVGCLPRRRP